MSAERSKDAKPAGAKGESPTVFGAPDQAEIIARIDAVSDDDLTSSFFENSLQDVEDAAVRMFDVGVRTLTDDNTPLAAFGTQPGISGEPQAQPSAVQQPVAAGAGDRFDDPSVRRAFILGGPGAVSR